MRYFILLFFSCKLLATALIHEDVWYDFADWVFSPEETFDPQEVKAGDVIVVKDLDSRLLETLHEFEESILPHITYPIILISPRTDFSLPSSYTHLLDHPMIGAWFVQNIDREETEKLHALPIGFVSERYGCNHTLLNAYGDNASSYQQTKRKRLLYLNFAMTNPDRERCVRHFKNNFPSHRFSSKKPFPRYLRDIMQSIFVVSPPGNGEDCHRTWEALLLGGYPIVKRSFLSPLFEGLPVIQISEWSEVTAELLRQKYRELSNMEWSKEKLYAEYWFDKVKAIQQKMRLQQAASE